MASVCGNGACEPSEDSDICYADCGPSPWQWTAEETDLLMRINEARAAGIDCPGGGGAVTGPALVLTASLVPGAREFAWEFAHHQHQPGSSTSCNGRTSLSRINAAGGTGAVSYTGTGTTPQTALSSWLASATLCPIVASTSFTRVGIGVAYDARQGYGVIVD